MQELDIPPENCAEALARFGLPNLYELALARHRRDAKITGPITPTTVLRAVLSCPEGSKFALVLAIAGARNAALEGLHGFAWRFEPEERLLALSALVRLSASFGEGFIAEDAAARIRAFDNNPQDHDW